MASSNLRIAIAGASGRMGRMLIETVLNTEGVMLSAALDQAHSVALGRDAAEFLGIQSAVLIHDDAAQAIAQSDVVIDFTSPEATLAHLAHAVEHKKAVVIGTTGFSPAEKAQIDRAAQQIPLVFAPNMAVGVNAVFKLLQVAAGILGPEYDVEIIEAHHRHKVDAPSGTALRMGEVVAEQRGQTLEEAAVYDRHAVREARMPGTIGFSAIRGGDIVGDHTVLFAGMGERIEITHKSASRQSYALGAVRAAKFLQQHQRGLFDMQDVLGLR